MQYIKDSKTNTEVKIVQRWNGVRPDVRFVYSHFLAYLVDKGNELHYSGAVSNNNWIEYCKTKSSRQIKSIPDGSLRVVILILTHEILIIYEEKANNSRWN